MKMTLLLITMALTGGAVPGSLRMQETPASAPRPDSSTTDGSEPNADERLDRPVEHLLLHDALLPDVLKKLEDATGVTLRIRDEKSTMSRLPLGPQTKLANVTIQNATLGRTLEKILLPLGLEYRLEADAIEIAPTPPMQRMDNASWQELRLLQQMRTTPYSPEAFAQLKVQYRLTSRIDGPALLGDQLSRSGRGTIAEMLETATGSLGWTWLPEDDHIAIITRQAAISRAMARRVGGTYTDRPLGEILFDLGREADVHVFLQPGTFQKGLLRDINSYTINFHNYSIRQVFDHIAADTGLAYRIEADGIHVGPAEDIERLRMQADNSAADPFVAKVTVPAGMNHSIEFLYRESELPADVLNLREKTKRDLIQQLRRTLTTQPATSSAPAAPTPGSGPGGANP